MMWCDAIGGMAILGAQGAAILRAANNCISQEVTCHVERQGLLNGLLG